MRKHKKPIIIFLLLLFFSFCITSCTLRSSISHERSKNKSIEWISNQKPIESLDLIRDYIFYSADIPEEDFPAYEDAIVELYNYLYEVHYVLVED